MSSSRRQRRRIVGRIMLWVGLLLMMAWSLAPFLWELTSSFQPDADLLSRTPHWWPSNFTLEHYRNVVGPQNFGRFFRSSIIVAGCASSITLVFGVLAAFALTRLRVPGKAAVLAGIMGISMFPHIAIVWPLYEVLNNAELLNTYRGLAGTYVGLILPLMVFIMYTQFQSIPRELDEAAVIDGAGRVRLLTSILLPIAAPGLVTAFLLGFIGSWNDLMIALAFTTSPSKQTIPVGIANFTSFAYDPVGDVAAAAMLAILPLVAITLLFQRRITAGLTAGSVKE